MKDQNRNQGQGNQGNKDQQQKPGQGNKDQQRFPQDKNKNNPNQGGNRDKGGF